MNFIDFKKAFDSVHRPSLWWILKKYGIPEDIITIIQNLYEGGESSVKWMGSVGDWFTVMTGVRQGCILSPLLFAIVIDWIMRKTLTSWDVGLEWTNGKRLCDLDYADDIVLLDSSIERMRKLIGGVEDEGRKVGLCMNVSKCKVMVSNN